MMPKERGEIEIEKWQLESYPRNISNLRRAPEFSWDTRAKKSRNYSLAMQSRQV
jgi:hypothetical protein